MLLETSKTTSFSIFSFFSFWWNFINGKKLVRESQYLFSGKLFVTDSSFSRTFIDDPWIFLPDSTFSWTFVNGPCIFFHGPLIFSSLCEWLVNIFIHYIFKGLHGVLDICIYEFVLREVVANNPILMESNDIAQGFVMFYVSSKVFLKGLS